MFKRCGDLPPRLIHFGRFLERKGMASHRVGFFGAGFGSRGCAPLTLGQASAEARPRNLIRNSSS